MADHSDFDSLGLIEPLLKALRTQGYEKPTPIQSGAIPVILSGRDLLGCARTGTGKTAAFALPCLQLMESDRKPVAPRSVRMLVLTPTRELAAQVEESFRVYGEHTGLRFALAFGGVGKAPQAKALERGVDVLVATPGRLLDLRGDGSVKLDAVEYFVLDEADRMLDMGFIHDMRKVFSYLPKRRHTMLFSATMPKAIKEIAASILTDPAFVSVDPVSAPAQGIEQRLYHAAKEQKRALLVKLLSDGTVDRALVFTRTKHLANRIAAQLKAVGIGAEAIHANKSQTHRTKVMGAFKSKDLRVLVATDIAARGIDVEELPHVINFEIPNEPETYVHRIGRTARAGASGTAYSFCEESERPFVKAIEKLIGASIPVLPLPELPELPAPPLLERPARGPFRSKEKEKKAAPEPKPPKQAEAAKPEKEGRFAKRDKPRKEGAPPRPEKLRRDEKPAKPRRDEPRDLDAWAREKAARIQDQIAHATGAGEGVRARAAMNEGSQERPRPPRAEEGRRDQGQGGKRNERDRQPKGPQDRKANPGPGRQNEPYPPLRGKEARAPISDEEAARRAANDPRQPGIIPFNGPPPRPREPEQRQGQGRRFGRRDGRR